MRKWFTYIVESLDPAFPAGHALIYDRPSIYCEKGVKRTMELMNLNTGKTRQVATVIGMGYADFKDEQDFKDRLKAVIDKKLNELGLSRRDA